MSNVSFINPPFQKKVVSFIESQPIDLVAPPVSFLYEPRLLDAPRPAANDLSGIMAEESDDPIDVQLADFCVKYHDDPYNWVLWAFDWGFDELEGFDGPDTWQIDFLKAWGVEIKKNGFDGVIPVEVVRMSTASGHGIGKSALVAWIILFIKSTRPFSKGIVTANTGDQLRTKTWGELAKWRSRCITGHWFELNSGKGSLSMYHRAWPETWRVDAQTCREENSEAFAGLHAANSSPYYIFDEASAVPDKIWEVGEGGLTDGEPFFFCFGNPTRNTGKFAQTLNPTSRWNPRQVDSRTAKMTNKLIIQQWLDDYGEDSDFFRVRVMGKLPKAGDMQFIPGDVVADAMRRDAGLYIPTDPLVCGIDVARGGNDNCYIKFRRGKDAKSERTYSLSGEKSRDSMVAATKFALILDRHKPDYIFMDATGIGGPIADRLRQLGYNVIDVHFGGKATDEKKYADRTSEMGARLRQWLMNGGSLPHNPQLENELTSREYWHDKKDRLVVEPKGGGSGDRKGNGSAYAGFKSRLGYSPDHTDALYLTFAEIVPQLEHGRGMLDVVPEARASMNTNVNDYDPMENM